MKTNRGLIWDTNGSGNLGHLYEHTAKVNALLEGAITWLSTSGMNDISAIPLDNLHVHGVIQNNGYRTAHAVLSVNGSTVELSSVSGSEYPPDDYTSISGQITSHSVRKIF